jgi:hypothetical protein
MRPLADDNSRARSDHTWTPWLSALSPAEWVPPGRCGPRGKRKGPGGHRRPRGLLLRPRLLGAPPLTLAR